MSVLIGDEPYPIDEEAFFSDIDWVEESREALEKAIMREDWKEMARIEKWLGKPDDKSYEHGTTNNQKEIS